MAIQSVLLKIISYLNRIYDKIAYKFMETIGNMLGDQEITWDATAKLKITQSHTKHSKIDTVQSNIIYKSCKYLSECSMYIKTCMHIF